MSRLHPDCVVECDRFRNGPPPFCEGTCKRLESHRPSGIEVVRAELLRAEPHHAWDGIASASDRVDGLLAEARCFFDVGSEASVPPWVECCTATVRRWVAVAREARRMHGGGR
jgi:hypothetical protein